MRGWVLGVAAALALLGGPAFGHKEKRTDACGCHHQWGLRPCHPKKKTPRCEAPVAQNTDHAHPHARPHENGKKPKRSPERTPAPEQNARAVDL